MAYLKILLRYSHGEVQEPAKNFSSRYGHLGIHTLLALSDEHTTRLVFCNSQSHPPMPGPLSNNPCLTLSVDDMDNGSAHRKVSTYSVP